MNESQALIGLQSCLALGVFWIFWQYCWKQYALERFRQDVFNIRDDMFLAIAQKQAPFGFTSSEHLICRRDLNQIIRCAPTINLVGLLSTFVTRRILAPNFSLAEFEHSRSVIHQSNDQRVKDFIQPHQTRLNKAALRFLLTGSLGFIAMTLIVISIALIIAILSAFKDLVKKAFNFHVLILIPTRIFDRLGQELSLVQEIIVQLILLSERRTTSATFE